MMLGLVPAIMPRPVGPVPAAPATQSSPVWAWNAIWNPPPVSAAMLGELPPARPFPQSAVPSVPATHSVPVLAWKAT
ncbi:MAG: hypothetical protein WKG01_02680 [Kofleriaceae bacterium]